MAARRPTIRYTSTPLPECARCAAPMRRPTWALYGGVCSGCATTPERFAAAERAAHLRTLTEAGRGEVRASVDARIERLAQRRGRRATPGIPP